MKNSTVWKLAGLLLTLGVALILVTCLAGCGQIIGSDGSLRSFGPTKTVTYTKEGVKVLYVSTGIWDTKIGVLRTNPTTGEVYLENLTSEQQMSQMGVEALGLARDVVKRTPLPVP